MNKILFTFSLQLQLQLTVDSVTHMYVGTVHVGIVDVHMVQLLYILHVLILVRTTYYRTSVTIGSTRKRTNIEDIFPQDSNSPTPAGTM